MSFRNHKIHLSLLRQDEQVLYNCTSHWLVHLRLPFLYLLSLALPLLALLLMQQSGTATSSLMTVLWFLFACYGLVMTTSFFLRSVNFELGGCVITNQRVLRFGFRGLSQMIEREILPNKIEDVKIIQKGFLGLISDVAEVRIHTSTNEVELLKNVIEPQKIRKAFAELVVLSKASSSASSPMNDQDEEESWIDDALGQSHGHAFDVDSHRDDMVDQIGDVFRSRDKN